MSRKKIIIVDENNNQIGAEYLPDAIEKGLIRRGVQVFVFNESHQLLLQQRSKNVFKPLKLDYSATGHVDEGESYEEAAYRELQEELGITGRQLEVIKESYSTTNYFSAAYRAVVPDDLKISYDPEEIQAIHWYYLEEIDEMVKKFPEKFTPAFGVVWSLLRDRLA